jgi:RNA polymerase sigma factor (sigma-70 family)
VADPDILTDFSLVHYGGEVVADLPEFADDGMDDALDADPHIDMCEPVLIAPLQAEESPEDRQLRVDLFTNSYRMLVRLAANIIRDVDGAEDIVMDSFSALRIERIRDREKVLNYLRQSVVNRSRSVLRHRVVVERNAPKPAPDEASAEYGAIALLERDFVVAALHGLPLRQRQVIFLRYYGDFSEAQIAETLHISHKTVKAHARRGLAALRRSFIAKGSDTSSA